MILLCKQFIFKLLQFSTDKLKNCALLRYLALTVKISGRKSDKHNVL